MSSGDKDGGSRGASRRNFIKGGSLLLAGGAVAAPTLAAPEDAGESGYDVIVIGAGFAGATAARELGVAGYRVLVLEARPRLGGRTFTTEFAGKQIELGGTWIHWHQPYVWAEMERYGLGVVESPVAEPTTGILLREDGSREKHDPMVMYESVMAGFGELFHDAMAQFPRPYDPLFRESVKELDKVSLAQRIRETGIEPRQRDMMTGVFGGLVGMDMEEAGIAGLMKSYALSGWNFVAFMDAMTRYKIEGGTIALVKALLDDSGADVRLATPVYSVQQADGRVAVTTDEDEVIRARAAVITVPRNTYRMIDFQPPLSPQKRALAGEDGMASGIKVYARVKENVGQIMGAGAENNPICFLQTESHGLDGSTLIGFGSYRSLLDINDGDAVAAEIRRYLPDATVLETTAYDWLYDPYSRGAWPAYRKGEMSTAVPELAAPEGSLFFAGSALAGGWHSWIDGAVETGIRAGREVRGYLG